eukprot:1196207-Prorocentrum_minimum.AAC.7
MAAPRINSERGPIARGEREYTRSAGQSREERGNILGARANRQAPRQCRCELQNIMRQRWRWRRWRWRWKWRWR